MNNSSFLYCWQCGLVLHGDVRYARFSLILMGYILPATAALGFVLNVTSAIIFGRRAKKSSSKTYLVGLSCSDACLTVGAIFVFALLRLQRLSDWVAVLYFSVVRVMFTLAMTVQCISVYFTVVAAIDCYIAVCHRRIKSAYCQVSVGIGIQMGVVVAALGYNLVHFFEMSVESCYWPELDRFVRTVCATNLRKNLVFNKWYYTIGYTAIMSIGPLLLLVVLCFRIVYTLRFKPRARPRTLKRDGARRGSKCRAAKSNKQLEDANTLIMVIALFIVCNLPALVLNLVEFFARPDPQLISYIVDISNYLVVVNATVNFVGYCVFNSQFRDDLSRMFVRTKGSRQDMKLFMTEYSVSHSGRDSDAIERSLGSPSDVNKNLLAKTNNHAL